MHKNTYFKGEVWVFFFKKQGVGQLVETIHARYVNFDFKNGKDQSRIKITIKSIRFGENTIWQSNTKSEIQKAELKLLP